MVFRQTARRTVRSGVLWGYVFGLYVATQALAYASSYKTVAQRIGLAKDCLLYTSTPRASPLARMLRLPKP